MNAIGLISLNPAVENVYFTEIAKRSLQYGLVCYRFIPTNMNPFTHKISGEKFDHQRQEWADSEFPLPPILYDRCFYGDSPVSKASSAIMKWLKSREDLCFLGCGLPNKWELYEKLSDSPLAPYILRTFQANGPKEVLSYLKKQKNILLKPVSGSGGRGIVRIIKEKEKISVSMEQQQLVKSSFSSEDRAFQWIEKLLSRDYLMQPFLPLSDHKDRPFDVRVFLQKDSEGAWAERGRGIRAGKPQGILSNLSAGAQTEDYQHWLKTLPPKDRQMVNEEIDDITKKLPHLLEEMFPPLFELGIDIGIAKDRSIWILDVNSKPGHKVVLETNPDAKEILYAAPLEYAGLLSTKREREAKP
ncbi:YheC/YheD family protein [Mesobacillus foraminis]|uniref:YheC/YheD family endospore coat-associated protein n=1 Tax=Mesobacillus foraminis TaxID=279826 RepID=UPI0039A34895